MSLLQMNRPSESARLLDDVALSCTVENRNSFSHSTTSIEAVCKELVFRASYRDIDLMMSIINKALNLASKASTGSGRSSGIGKASTTNESLIGSSMPTTHHQSNVQSITSGTVVISKEQVKSKTLPSLLPELTDSSSPQLSTESAWSLSTMSMKLRCCILKPNHLVST